MVAWTHMSQPPNGILLASAVFRVPQTWKTWNCQEIFKPGKVWEFEMWSGNFYDMSHVL